jgi:ABC-2 type transport system ATP-binding protein
MNKAFELHHLVKEYPDFRLGPLDMTLDPGLVLGYIGPNGSGKTTTMHCLTGLVRPDAGDMTVFGRPVDPRRVEWRREIGYVGDVHVFYERLTARRNLDFLAGFYPRWSRDRVLELARRFELPLDKKARELSGGNRVKLALVAALAPSPRLLLLDEPTAGLDPLVRAEVLETLFEVLADGESAIFYSTHILGDISRLADELAFLCNGRVIRREARDDLLEQWRRISYRGAPPDASLPAVVGWETNGTRHKVVTERREATLAGLRASGAEVLEETRLSIDEIAVYILKGGRDVAHPGHGDPVY